MNVSVVDVSKRLSILSASLFVHLAGSVKYLNLLLCTHERLLLCVDVGFSSQPLLGREVRFFFHHQTSALDWDIELTDIPVLKGGDKAFLHHVSFQHGIVILSLGILKEGELFFVVSLVALHLA